MKSDRPPAKARPGPAGVRPIQPREPLSPVHHMLLGFALVAGLLILLTLAWVVRQWQIRSLAEASLPAATETVATTLPVTPENPSGLAAIPSAALSRGNHLIVGCENPVQQINPLYQGNLEERDAAALIFETLLQTGPSGQVEFELASGQSFDPATHQLTFTLRDDHVFTDGSVLNASDVAWTYQLILSGSYDGPLKAWLAGITGIVVDNPLQVTFQLADWVTEPDPAWFTVGILQKHAYPADLARVFELGQASPWPEGSGAYRLQSLADGTAILELRPGFAGALKTIEFQPVDSADQFDLLQAGAIDITYSYWNARSKERLDNLPGYRAQVFPSTRAYVLVNRPDNLAEAQDETRLGQALLLALSGQPLDDAQVSLLADQAKEPLVCPYYRGIDQASAAVYLADARTSLAPLAALGLQINFESCDWPDLASRALEKRYDLMVIPAPADEQLPAGTRLLSVQPGHQSISQANAWPGASEDRVVFYSRRLSQLTINPNAFPLASASLGWTDRIENIRLAGLKQGG